MWTSETNALLYVNCNLKELYIPQMKNISGLNVSDFQ